MAQIERCATVEDDIKTIASLDLRWAALDGKTLLISGGTGFIGQFLIDVIKYRNDRYGNRIKVIGCSRHALPSERDVEYLSHDITIPMELERHVDFVLHLASNTHPKQYAADPVGTITTNIFGTYNLLNLAKVNGARFLLASSVEIYGEGGETPMTEEYCGYLNCNTARAGYNEAKRLSESLCQSFSAQYGVDCVIARLARVFGADRKDDSKAMAQFMSKAVNGEDIILKSAGTQRFSYCYVADAASGILKILLDGVSGNAYNVSDDDEGLNLGDYAKAIAELAGKNVLFDLDNVQSGASAATFALLDCDKLKKTGWTPCYSVSDALRKTFKILKERR
ncbi:MAG: NAD-dependent epimerase/dehydratase family protein [Clostridiales bacterium]|nr:NAD-dependent epimerase/dehydratase family protein [Clostridiales bacterium]